jgi:hypothetical protein
MSDQTHIYVIRVESHLDARHLRLYEGMTVTHLGSGETRITGPVVDQAALLGLLNHLRDLGVTLIAANRVSDGEQA